MPLSKSMEIHSPADERAASQNGSNGPRSTPATLGSRRSTSAALMRSRPGTKRPPRRSRWHLACRAKGTIFSPKPPASRSSETTTSKRSSSLSHSSCRRSAHRTRASPSPAEPVPAASPAKTRRAQRAKCGVISTPTTSSAPARSASADKTPTPQPRSAMRQPPPAAPSAAAATEPASTSVPRVRGSASRAFRASATASQMPCWKTRFRGASFIISEYHSSSSVRASGGVAKSETSSTSNQKRLVFQWPLTGTSRPGWSASSLAGNECTHSKDQDFCCCSIGSEGPKSATQRSTTASGRPGQETANGSSRLPLVSEAPPDA
mmetsp:Transcript_162947/g.522506  ORF Transcript_162947/g.522506 Transcript_162947/m.522506 type:complete len:321 (+) Transcript_162947:848-1810(+)